MLFLLLQRGKEEKCQLMLSKMKSSFKKKNSPRASCFQYSLSHFKTRSSFFYYYFFYFFLLLYECISERKVSLFAWVDKPFNSEKQSFNGAPCTGVGSIHNGEDRVTCYFRPDMTANNCLTNICISNRTPGTSTILGCLPVSRWDKARQLSTTFHTIMVFLKGVSLYPRSRSVLPNAKAYRSNCTLIHDLTLTLII